MKPRPTGATRREFLKTAGVAVTAPYVITSAALGAAAGRPASERITTALIGSGSRGQQIMAGGDRVVAVCDVDEKKRKQAKAKIDALAGNRSCKAHSDFRAVLARDDIDAVLIATGDRMHAVASIIVTFRSPMIIYSLTQLKRKMRRYRYWYRK